LPAIWQKAAQEDTNELPAASYDVSKTKGTKQVSGNFPEEIKVAKDNVFIIQD